MEPPRGVRRWSFVDIVITAGIFAAMACLFLPRIYDSRITAQFVGCQDHLRRLTQGLQQFDPSPARKFPSPVSTQANVLVPGQFVSQLFHQGLVKEPKYFTCPSLPMNGQGGITIPRTNDWDIASPRNAQWAALNRVYAYNIGYFDGNNRYCPPRNRGRSHVPIVADRPTYTPVGPINNLHRGKGLNVAMEDGTVR